MTDLGKMILKSGGPGRSFVVMGTILDHMLQTYYITGKKMLRARRLGAAAGIYNVIEVSGGLLVAIQELKYSEDE